jgi:hypothetical protein
VDREATIRELWTFAGFPAEYEALVGVSTFVTSTPALLRHPAPWSLVSRLMATGEDDYPRPSCAAQDRDGGLRLKGKEDGDPCLERCFGG